MSPAQRLGLLHSGDPIIVPQGSVPLRALPRPYVSPRFDAGSDKESNSLKLLRRLVAGRGSGRKE